MNSQVRKNKYTNKNIYMYAQERRNKEIFKIAAIKSERKITIAIKSAIKSGGITKVYSMPPRRELQKDE